MEFLIIAVANALTSAGWLVKDILDRKDSSAQRRVAHWDNVHAREILAQLVHMTRHEDATGILEEIVELRRIAEAEKNATTD